jgi:pimeloyl-ACP methyl ester carboxylesterase
MTRREMLQGTGLAVMGGALATAPPVAAHHGERRNFLLVHGSWHSAAHWNEVAEDLVASGHRVHAIDLPGSGLDAAYPQSYLRNDFAALATEPSPAANIHLADYRDAIVEQLRRMAPHGKVTLVGHSFGGLAITAAAEAAPELIRRLVYLTAYVPSASAPTGAALGALPEGQSSMSGAIMVADPMTTGAMRINPRNGDPDYVEKGRQALYGDVSTDEYLRFAAYFNPDLPLAVALDDARGTERRWGRVERTFIRTTQDHAVPLALQDRMIADADAATPRNRFDVRTLESSHSPFASMPGELAAVLSDL